MALTTRHHHDVPAPSEMLTRLLDADLEFDTVTSNGLSSHLSMALVAAERLGAPSARLDELFARHTARLATPRQDPDRLVALREKIARTGIETVVAEQAGGLAIAPSTEWFHAVIRLAYAVEVRHEGQVAGALISWSRHREILPVPSPLPGTKRFADVVAALDANPELMAQARRDLPTVAGVSGFASAVDGIAIDEGTLADVAAVALAAYVASADFSTLHMVTGAHAARTVAPLLSPDAIIRFVGRTAQAMAAAYLASGTLPLPDRDALDVLRATAVPGWDEIAARAVASPNVHVIKLVYSCRAEHEHHGDPLYRYVAARAARLV